MGGYRQITSISDLKYLTVLRPPTHIQIFGYVTLFPYLYLVKRRVGDIDSGNEDGRLLRTAIMRLSRYMGREEEDILSYLSTLSFILFPPPIMDKDPLEEFRSLLGDEDFLYIWRERLSQAFLHSYYEWRRQTGKRHPSSKELIHISTAAADIFLKSL